MIDTTQNRNSNGGLPHALADGLVLRLATTADVEPLIRFNVKMHGTDAHDRLELAAYTRDLLAPGHPTCGVSNFSIVEDTQTREIVSSMCLIPQTWTYAGIPFDVGRMELVGTEPDYRRRGLVRAQFALWHTQSAARGQQAQAITGIPWYYRQFGYEYALDLNGGRSVYLCDIPGLQPGETEPFRLRPMTHDDLPFVMPLYEQDCARRLVACPRPPRLWNYFMAVCSPQGPEYQSFQLIETTGGVPAGYLAARDEIYGRMMRVYEFNAADGRSYRALAPAVLRALRAGAEREAAARQVPLDAVKFSLGVEHPLFDAIPELLPRQQPPYGWYMRVADVPRFLQHIAPALEERLARSALAGHSGALKISEYRAGFELKFDDGRLSGCRPWQGTDAEADARFPPPVFLQLLFGFRRLGELRAAYPDCVVKDEARPLLDVLFPRRASNVRALG